MVDKPHVIIIIIRTQPHPIVSFGEGGLNTRVENLRFLKIFFFLLRGRRYTLFSRRNEGSGEELCVINDDQRRI